MDNQNYNLNYENNYNVDPTPAPRQEQSRKPAITAMIIGLLGLTFGCIPLIGSIPGIVLSIIGLVKTKNLSNYPVPQTRGFIKGGKISSIIGLILSIVITVIYLVIIIAASSYSHSGYYRYY